MTDFADRAAQAEAAFLTAALEAQQSEQSATTYSHCWDCGEEIPKARQLAVAGCKLCVDCQAYKEKGWL